MNDPADNFNFGSDDLNDPAYGDDINIEDSFLDEEEELGTEAVENPQPDATPEENQDTPAAPEQPVVSEDNTVATDTPAEQPRSATGIATGSDNKGNLVDADGHIVASAGAERRQYEKTVRTNNHINTLEQTVRERDAQLAELQKTTANEYELSPHERDMGMRAMASFKKDPVATAKWMLQEAMQKGYSLGDIIGQDAQGQLNGGSLDLSAVRSMITSAVQPLVSDREQANQVAQQQQAAEREYTSFIAKHEHAELHGEVIAGMLQEQPNLTPEVAYWQLREYVTRNNLDFSQPLSGQQPQQRAQVQQPQVNAAPQPQQQEQPRSMPMGTGTATDLQKRPTTFGPNDDWDDIIQDSLRSAGL